MKERKLPRGIGNNVTFDISNASGFPGSFRVSDYLASGGYFFNGDAEKRMPGCCKQPLSDAHIASFCVSRILSM